MRLFKVAAGGSYIYHCHLNCWLFSEAQKFRWRCYKLYARIWSSLVYELCLVLCPQTLELVPDLNQLPPKYKTLPRYKSCRYLLW
jgi:hypothetical protein